MYPEGWGKFSALLVFVDLTVTFFPAGHSRLSRTAGARYHHAYAPESRCSTLCPPAGASILGVGFLDSTESISLWSWKYGTTRRHKIHGALSGLEWQPLRSPPTTFNFDVTRRSSPKKPTHTQNTRRRTLADHAVATDHPPQLRHHFDDMGQQFDSATFGMWVFLLTEIMFFGGMFGAYTIYRSMYPEASLQLAIS